MALVKIKMIRALFTLSTVWLTVRATDTYYPLVFHPETKCLSADKQSLTLASGITFEECEIRCRNSVEDWTKGHCC